MKKLILIILLLFPLCQVKAVDYYTSYTEWEVVENIPELTSDVLEVQEEKQYLWYRLEKDGNYFKIDEDHSNFPNKTEFWKYDEWSNWNSLKIEKVDGREIEERTIYHYQVMKPIKFIRLSEISGGEFRVLSAQIYKNGREISFTQYEDNSDLIFELSEDCYVDEIEISFILFDTTSLQKHFKIEWLYDLSIPSCVETSTWFTFTGVFNTTYLYRHMNDNYLLWDDENVSLEKVESNAHQKVWVEEEYRYRDRMDYYEREERIYDKEYHSVPSTQFPYPDLETEQTIFKVRMREKKSFDDIDSLKMYIEKLQEQLRMQEQTMIGSNDSLFSLKKQIEELQESMKGALENANQDININDDLQSLYKKVEFLHDDILALKPKMVFTPSENQEVVSDEKLEETCLLENELHEANATIMELKNEKSNTLEGDRNSFSLKRQSIFFPLFILLILLIAVIELGRILTTKKKF